MILAVSLFLLGQTANLLLADDDRNDAVPAESMGEGLTPPEAAAKMTVPEGFRVQLAAGEPMIHQPIAMCFDHRGRLWVAEGHTYPRRAPNGQGKDKILIFEDTTGDGVFDKSKVFIEGLNLVSGLEVGFGGVYVGAAPYLMFIPDADFDDQPDEPTSQSPVYDSKPVQFPDDVPPGATVLLDGFGWQDTHETLNAFIWGPDGWLYGCHGVFTHSKVGKPGTPAKKRQGLNAGVWRYHPVKHEFEVFAHGTSNPWGVDFNDQGQAFISACVIPHLWHMVQGGRYHRQGGRHFNPHTYDDIKTIADHQHYVGDLRDHAWWGHEPRASGGTSEAGGGHAHCGLMCYRGDNWPEEYRNQLFFNNIHGNRINQDSPDKRKDGSGFVGRHKPDFLFANDHYYRGINLRYGPDGSVYLIDWYDKNACHRTNPEIWDRSNGRIYRISYGDCPTVNVDLESLGSKQLAEYVTHSNNWYVTMARRILQHRAANSEVRKSIQKHVYDQMRFAINPLGGIQHEDRLLNIMWTLHATGVDATSFPFDPKLPYATAWAIQLELEDRSISAERLDELTDLAGDTKSAVIRMYAASALQRLPLEQRWDLADTLLQHAEDADDHNIPLLLWYGVEPLVVADPDRAMKLAANSKIDLVRQYLVRRAASETSAIDSVVGLLRTTNDATIQEEVLDEMLAAFEGRVGISMPASWKPVYEKLSDHDSQSVADKADQLAILFGDVRIFPKMRQLVRDTSETPERRLQALNVLVRGQDRNSADVLLSEAVLGQPILQRPAIRGLSTIGNDDVPKALLSRYSSWPEAAQKDAVSTLVSRPLWTKQLLQAIGAGSVPVSDLHAYHVRQIQTFSDKTLNDLLEQHWGRIATSSEDRLKQIAEWKQKLTKDELKQADLSNGRRVYSKTCQSCHRLFGTGGDIGPDITGSNRANLDYLLENILDPSALVGRNYQMTVLFLESGQTVSGILKKETDSALTIQTLNDQVVVPKSELEERTLSKVSMMPEKQLEGLSPNDARDLIAYLQSPEQVAMSGPKADINPQTGRVDGALEAESLKVIEKTAGQVRNQKMSGFSKDRWSGNDQLWWTGGKPGDRLSLEVPVEEAGTYDLQIVLTKAHDYGVVELLVNSKSVDAGIDLYDAENVVTTGVLTYSGIRLKEGSATVTLKIAGANPKATKRYMAAIDFIRLMPSPAQ